MIGIGIYQIKQTISALPEQSDYCFEGQLIETIRRVQFFLMGGIVGNGIYFFVSLMIVVITLILKKCRHEENQLSSDEQDEINFN